MSNTITTNIKWIPEINSSWRIGRVKDLFYVSKELSSKENPVILSLARSAVKVRDISNNEGQLAASYEKYNSVKVGDLLLNPMDLYSGANCNVSYVEGVISPAYSNLRAKEKLDPRFYDYFFKVQYWTMAMFAHGNGVSFDNRWTLNNEGLLNYEIPMLPYDEQKAIADTLETKIAQIDSLVANQEKQIERLESFKQTFIDNVMNCFDKWKLKYLSSGICDGTHGSFDRVEEGHYLLSAKNLGGNELVFADNESRISYNDYLSIIKNGFPKKNDILMCCVGDVGKTVLYTYDEIFAFQRSVMFVRPNAKVDPRFLRYALMTTSVKEQETKLANKTIQAGLYQGLVKELLVSFTPSIEKQHLAIRSIDDKCESLDKLISIKRKKIEELKEYKKSLIYEYVTGKRRVA